MTYRSRMLKGTAALVAGVLSIALTTAASAGVIISIERVSDTLGIATVSGSIDYAGSPPANHHILTLDNPFGTPAILGANNSVYTGPGTLTIGGHTINFAYDAGANFDLAQTGNAALYFGTSPNFADGDVANGGQISFQLQPYSTWAAVGSSGSVYWGAQNPDVVNVGRWIIVGESVPAPAALGFLGLGLAGLGFAKRRRKA